MRAGGGGRVAWLARTLALPASAAIHTPKVLFSGELNTLGQRLAGVAMLYRLRLWRMGDALGLLAGEGR